MSPMTNFILVERGTRGVTGHQGVDGVQVVDDVKDELIA